MIGQAVRIIAFDNEGSYMLMLKPEIVPLPKEKWKGTVIPLGIRSDSWYELEMQPLNEGGLQHRAGQESGGPGDCPYPGGI